MDSALDVSTPPLVWCSDIDDLGTPPAHRPNVRGSYGLHLLERAAFCLPLLDDISAAEADDQRPADFPEIVRDRRQRFLALRVGEDDECRSSGDERAGP